MRFSRSLSLLTAAAVLAPAIAGAISFPDVSSNYPHKAAIEGLADKGVIGGNPDGTFRPRDPIDRASILKMLYKAANLTPDAGKKGCMSDVVAGSWYENFVCDAVARGFVSGYEENGKKLFKPARPVSRSEALKLSLVILGIQNVSADTQVKMYTDVKAADWFAPFVRTALAVKVLPTAGQDGTVYQPTVPMERGEAAAYIWNALGAKGTRGTVSSSSVGGAKSSAPATDSQSSRKRVEDAVSTDVIVSKDFPFTDRRTAPDTDPVTFKFSTSSTQVVQVTVSTDKGRVTCALYRFGDNGFSTEYYLGLEEGKECHIRATIERGNYQIQTEANTAGATVGVDAKTGTGDGNDGFSQAKKLEHKKIRSDLLDANDLDDWFTFTITKDTSINTIPGTERTVKVISNDALGCIVYPLADVDLFGFEGPQCNAVYKYPVGTYVVNVRHSVPRAAQQAYSIELQ